MSVYLRLKNWWGRMNDPKLPKGFVHLGTFRPGESPAFDGVASDAAYNCRYVPGSVADPYQNLLVAIAKRNPVAAPPGQFFWNPVFSYPYGLTEVQRKRVNEIVDHYRQATVAISQLKFLLSQAPMHMAPEDRFRATQSTAKFAYIHPKTFVKYQEHPVRAYGKVVGSQTKWVMTSLMTEGHVIYSPNPIPGIEKLLES